jgi:large subunit ribosomal protein L28
MAKCERCGKSPQFGQSRSHSMRATKRQYKVNLQRATVWEDGRKRRIRVCARCLRTMAKT